MYLIMCSDKSKDNFSNESLPLNTSLNDMINYVETHFSECITPSNSKKKNLDTI